MMEPTLGLEDADTRPLYADLPEEAPARAGAARPPTLAVLEVCERGRHLAQTLPVTAWPCIVGRAAYADAVLADPALAAEHLRLHLDEHGQVRVQVLDHVNGVWLGRKQQKGGQTFVWPPGKTLSLGRMQIGLRLASAQLPAPQPWRPASRLGALITALACLALMGFIAIDTLLDANTAGNLLTRVLRQWLDISPGLFIWTLLWMLAGKLFTGYSIFGRHLRIAVLGLLGYASLLTALHLLAYVFSLPQLARFDISLAYAVMGITVWRHLCAATPLPAGALGVVMGALLAVVLTAQLGLQWHSQKRLGQGTLYLSHLYLPDWRIAPAHSIEAFTQDARSLQSALAERVHEQDARESDDFDEDE